MQTQEGVWEKSKVCVARVLHKDFRPLYINKTSVLYSFIKYIHDKDSACRVYIA